MMNIFYLFTHSYPQHRVLGVAVGSYRLRRMYHPSPKLYSYSTSSSFRPPSRCTPCAFALLSPSISRMFQCWSSSSVVVTTIQTFSGCARIMPADLAYSVAGCSDSACSDTPFSDTPSFNAPTIRSYSNCWAQKTISCASLTFICSFIFWSAAFIPMTFHTMGMHNLIVFCLNTIQSY